MIPLFIHVAFSRFDDVVAAHAIVRALEFLAIHSPLTMQPYRVRMSVAEL